VFLSDPSSPDRTNPHTGHTLASLSAVQDVPQNPHSILCAAFPAQAGHTFPGALETNLPWHIEHVLTGGSSFHFLDLHEGHVLTVSGSAPSLSTHLWPHLKHFSLKVSLSHVFDLHPGQYFGASVLLFQT
jgi:hypothetical protein